MHTARKMEMLFGLYKRNILGLVKTSELSAANASRSFKFYSFGSRPSVSHPNRRTALEIPQLLDSTSNLFKFRQRKPCVSESNLFNRARSDNAFREYANSVEQRPLLQTTLFYYENIRSLRPGSPTKDASVTRVSHVTAQLSPEIGSPLTADSPESLGGSPKRYYRTLTPSTQLVRHVHTIDDFERAVDNENNDLVVYVGMRLLGWLEVVSLLGRGSFGQVFLCKDLRISEGHFQHPETIDCEDFAYWNCSHEYLPEGDANNVPLHNPLVAVKVVKSEPLIESQSVLEAEMLVILGSQTREGSETKSDHGNLSLDSDPRTRYISRVLADGASYGHHCIVMERYGANMYEFVSNNQHRGLPMFQIRSIGFQLFSALTLLEDCHIVHADIKPENMMLTLDSCQSGQTNGVAGPESSLPIPLTRARESPEAAFQSGNTRVQKSLERSLQDVTRDSKQVMVPNPNRSQPLLPKEKEDDDRRRLETDPSLHIKLIDFSSSCYVGGPLHSYIQSRYYRAPEVILQTEYSSEIDIWSTGCVLAELLLGLPLMPGATDHHQIMLIEEVIGPIPHSLLAKGKSTSLYYDTSSGGAAGLQGDATEDGARSGESTTFTLRSREEFLKLRGLPSDCEYRHFFSFKTLKDLVRHCPLSPLEKQLTLSTAPGAPMDVADIRAEILQQRFLLFGLLKALLQPDPKMRPTAAQALQHPFFTSKTMYTEVYNLK
ncbi:Protein kinase domain containing protein, putative [Angomonas deanei]|uniref:Protein kinase domain containing protein, putative n=1 Tax=Angomonas deanei TaxID=59799 RepID=A0A7G2CCE7_9TRYP|nr:Protein kinase domain containing protein, putative [Angomonas deanei]